MLLELLQKAIYPSFIGYINFLRVLKLHGQLRGLVYESFVIISTSVDSAQPSFCHSFIERSA